MKSLKLQFVLLALASIIGQSNPSNAECEFKNNHYWSGYEPCLAKYKECKGNGEDIHFIRKCFAPLFKEGQVCHGCPGSDSRFWDEQLRKTK